MRRYAEEQYFVAWSSPFFSMARPALRIALHAFLNAG
jgi:hypothetical protein